MTYAQRGRHASQAQQPGSDGEYRPVVGEQQQPARYQELPARQPPQHRSVRLTSAEAFWYVLGCIAAGGMYFAKVPVKKALQDAGLAHMTAAERFWYVLMCIPFGAGYFCKVPVKKALSEAHPPLQ